MGIFPTVSGYLQARVCDKVKALAPACDLLLTWICPSHAYLSPALVHLVSALLSSTLVLPYLCSASLLTVFPPQPHWPQFWCLNTALPPTSLRPFHSCASAGRVPLPVLHQVRSFSSVSSQCTYHFFREACCLSSSQSPQDRKKLLGRCREHGWKWESDTGKAGQPVEVTTYPRGPLS